MSQTKTETANVLKHAANALKAAQMASSEMGSYGSNSSTKSKESRHIVMSAGMPVEFLGNSLLSLS